MKFIARKLRKNQTPSEQKIWNALRNRQLDGLKFRRQHPVGPYIVDFFCASKNLIIEIDGDVHAFQVARDKNRENWLQSEGYIIIRFTNEEVNQCFHDVMKAVATICQQNHVR